MIDFLQLEPQEKACLSQNWEADKDYDDELVINRNDVSDEKAVR